MKSVNISLSIKHFEISSLIEKKIFATLTQTLNIVHTNQIAYVGNNYSTKTKNQINCLWH